MENKVYNDGNIEISVRPNVHPDKFEILYDPSIRRITVKRLDQNTGWGQDLSLNLKYIKENKSRIVQVGPSNSNISHVSFSSNENIPKNIYICYRTKKIPSFVMDDLKLYNPGYEIKLYDNPDCVDFLNSHFDKIYSELFMKIPNGAIKADFWRVCVLYKLGGFYFDIDVHHKASIDEYLDPRATFITSTSVTPAHMNPIVLGSRAGNPVLEACIESYMDRIKYKQRYDYWGWSICGTMYRALRKVIGVEVVNGFCEIVNSGEDTYQFVSEDKNAGHRSGYFTHWKGKRILDNHHDEYLETPHFKGFREPQKPFENERYKIEVEEHPYSDIFEITSVGSFAEVRRLDANLGWEQNLMLKVTDKHTDIKTRIVVGPSSENRKRVELVQWRRNKTSADKPKMLLILAGEAFRHGDHGRERDTPESYEPQKKACLSHMGFISHVKDKFGLSCDILLNSYRTKYIEEIIDWYSPNLSAYSFRSDLVGLEALIRDAIDEANFEDYECALFTRVDIEFKSYFNTVFNPSSDKLMFPSLCWRHMAYLTAGPEEWVPRVSDTMLFVPKRLFGFVKKKFSLNHHAWLQFRNHGLKREDMGFFLDTFHDSDSAKDYNPIFRMASRRDSKKFYSPNLKVGDGLRPVRTFDYIGFPDWKPGVTLPYEDEELVVALQYDSYVKTNAFSIGVDKPSNSVVIKRTDSPSGWDMNVALFVKNKKTGKEGELYVGKSSENEKKVSLDYVPNRFEDDRIRLLVKKNGFADVFHLEMEGDMIHVTRLDELTGWGQQLSLSAKEKATGRRMTIKVGSSNSNRKSIKLDPAQFATPKQERVAVCIVGAMSRKSGASQFRGDIYNNTSGYIDYKAVHKSIEKHILAANPGFRFDVFIHSWNKDLCADLEFLYKPEDSLFEDNEMYADEITDRCQNPYDFSGISFALSIKRALQLKEARERKSGFTYDKVLIYRPDVLIWKDMDLSDYDVEDGVFVNGHPGGNGHFHFVMSSENAALFKGLYDSPLKGNKHRRHHWIKKFVEDYMKKSVIMDDIIPGEHQEIARPEKMKLG